MPRFIKINIIFWVLFFVTVPASSELYQYTDKNGIMRLTNDIYSVPPEYRSQLEAFSELESISNEMDIQPLENKSLPQTHTDKAHAEKIIAPKTPKALSADTGTKAIPPTAPAKELKETASGPEEKAADPFQPIYSEKPVKEPAPAAAVTASHKSKKIAIDKPIESKDEIDEPIHKIDQTDKIAKTDKIDNNDIKAEPAEKAETDKTVKADHEPGKTDKIDSKASSLKTATAAPEKNITEIARQAEPEKEVLQTQVTGKDQTADVIPPKPVPVPVKTTKTKKEIQSNQVAAEPKTAKITTEPSGTPEKAIIKPAEPEKKEKAAPETKTVKKENPDNTPPRQIAAATGKPIETPKTAIPSNSVAVKKTAPVSQIPTAIPGAAVTNKTDSDTAKNAMTPIISKETVSSEPAAAASAELLMESKTTTPKKSIPKEVAADSNAITAAKAPAPEPAREHTKSTYPDAVIKKNTAETTEELSKRPENTIAINNTQPASVSGVVKKEIKTKETNAGQQTAASYEAAATLPAKSVKEIQPTAKNLPVPAPKTVLAPGSASKPLKKEASEKFTAETAAQIPESHPESRPETQKTIQPSPLPADTQTAADVKTVPAVVKTETPKKIIGTRKPAPSVKKAALNDQATPLPDKTSNSGKEVQQAVLKNQNETPAAELSRRAIADDEPDALKMTDPPKNDIEKAGVKDSAVQNVVMAKKENSSPDHDDEALKLARLETTRVRLAEKKEALNKKYLSLMKEKQEIENSVDEEDEKSVLKYNESVKKLNFKIKQYKIAKKRLQAEIEKYNNTIRQSALN